MSSDILLDTTAHWADGYLFACKAIGGRRSREIAACLKPELRKKVIHLRRAEKKLRDARRRESVTP